MPPGPIQRIAPQITVPNVEDSKTLAETIAALKKKHRIIGSIRMRPYASIFLVSLLLVVVGCTKPTAPDEAANTMTLIRGTVTDAAGHPIPGAGVTVNYYNRPSAKKGGATKSCSLLCFMVSGGGGQATIFWVDSALTNAVRWDVQRAYLATPMIFQTIAARSAGTNPLHNSYYVVDSTVVNGTLAYYRLDLVAPDGSHTYFGTSAVWQKIVWPDRSGSYWIPAVPVDALVPVIDGNGSQVAADTIGTSFWIWGAREDYYEDMHQVTVAKNCVNTLDFVLSPIGSKLNRGNHAAR